MFNNSQTYSDIWQLCLNRIKEQTSAEEFAKWFQPIVPLEFDGTTLRLRVPNESYVRQIEKNYIAFLKPIISPLRPADAAPLRRAQSRGAETGH